MRERQAAAEAAASARRTAGLAPVPRPSRSRAAAAAGPSAVGGAPLDAPCASDAPAPGGGGALDAPLTASDVLMLAGPVPPRPALDPYDDGFLFAAQRHEPTAPPPPLHSPLHSPLLSPLHSPLAAPLHASSADLLAPPHVVPPPAAPLPTTTPTRPPAVAPSMSGSGHAAASATASSGRVGGASRCHGVSPAPPQVSPGSWPAAPLGARGANARCALALDNSATRRVADDGRAPAKKPRTLPLNVSGGAACAAATTTTPPPPAWVSRHSSQAQSGRVFQEDDNDALDASESPECVFGGGLGSGAFPPAPAPAPAPAPSASAHSGRSFPGTFSKHRRMR